MHYITRRQFIGITATAPLFAALGAEEPFAPPVVVFSKVYQEINLSYEDSAALTAEAGLDGIDCAVRPKGEVLPERAAEDMPRYAEILQKHKVRMMLLTTGILNPQSPHAETILRTAKSLGIRYYRLGYWKKETVATVRAQLKELAALNKQIGVCALFQHHSGNYVGADLGQLREIVEGLSPDEIAVAFDLGHAIITHGEEWPGYFEKLKPWIKVAYVKDAKRGAGFVPFGEGDFGKTNIFRRLRAMDYRAPLSMHIEYEWVPKGQPKTRAALLNALKASRQMLTHWMAT